MLNCCIRCENEPVCSFLIRLHIYVNVISVITTKWHICSHPHRSNSVVPFLCLNSFIGTLKDALKYFKECTYEQIVLPSIYCSTIWDPYYQNAIHKVEMIQHRAAHFIFWYRNVKDSITQMISGLNWPTFQYCRKYVWLTFLLKLLYQHLIILDYYLPSPSPYLL